MAANFDPALPTLKDRARARLGDVGPAYILQDETYVTVLASYGTFNDAIAELAEAIGSFYIVSDGRKTLGDQTVDYKGRAKNFFDLAKSLRTDAVAEVTIPTLDAGSEAGDMPSSCYFPF